MRGLFALLILILSTQFLFCQENRVEFYHLDKLSLKFKTLADSLKKTTHFDEAILNFRLNGFLGIYPTDTVVKKHAVHYYFAANKQFKKIELVHKNDPKKVQYRKKSIAKIVIGINEELIYLENSGYPFAEIKIVEQIENDDNIKLTYSIDSGSFYVVDKIHIKSTGDFHEKTVLSILGMKAGDVYNEEKIRNLETILLSSEAYLVPKSPEILFREGKAEVYVYIERKKSSSADGFIGFQQDRVTERIVLNGYVNLQLKNALNRAETIHLNWKNNPDKTQNLKTILEYPYLFGTPFGIGSDVNLQKQDTSFVRSDLSFAVTYRNPQFRVSVFNQFENSNTISSVPINGFRDFSKNTIGASVLFRPILSDVLSFYHPSLFVTAGLYAYRNDTLATDKRTVGNNKFQVKYAQTIDFLKYFHLNNSLQLQAVSSIVPLARNEFIFFGGLQSVRGFYELELEGKEIWILSNELEFKPIESLSLKILYDYANFVNTSKNYTHSIGFGFGLINNSNQLEIIVANGKLNDNPFALNGTKIHIGFKSNF